jgi:hypothetical protein
MQAFEQNRKMLLLRESLPEFSAELERLLVQCGHHNLAEQISTIAIVDRCRCGDDFCGTFYAAPKPEGSYGSGHENIVLEPDKGTVILDVVNGQIKCVEVLYRDEIRCRLQELLP